MVMVAPVVAVTVTFEVPVLAWLLVEVAPPVPVVPESPQAKSDRIGRPSRSCARVILRRYLIRRAHRSAKPPLSPEASIAVCADSFARCIGGDRRRIQQTLVE
jgi:hypothetical protein